MAENENRFSLIEEPWIPVVDVGRVSLRQLFSEPHLRAFGGNAQQKIALMKLLQALCQSAVTLKDEQQWLALRPKGVSHAVLAYLDKWQDRFWLYGDRPFLQMPAIARAEIKPFGTVQPEVSTGNTTVLTERQSEKALSDADKALLLVVQMSLALGGKKTDNSVVLSAGYRGKTNDKGKPATGRFGPGLAFLGLMHSFCVGETLAETFWLNLLTQKEIALFTQYPQGCGVAPWEQMPEGEDCAVARSLKQTLMGRLVPVSRFCLLAEAGLHYSEGISHSSYKEGLYDPSVLVNKKGKELKVQWINPGRRPWRELTSLLAFLSPQQSEWECEQLRMATDKASLSQRCFGIWSGGLSVSSNAGEQYVSGSDDQVESLYWLDPAHLGDSWFYHFKNEMSGLEGLAKTLYGSVSRWCREMKLEPKEYAARATEHYWQLCETQAQTLLESSPDSDQRLRLRKQFAEYVYRVYDATCSGQNARQLGAWAEARPVLTDYLRSTTGKEVA
ncbi:MULTISPECIES: type I-E CRISPR-associated protein Cse1/CasA [Enterobacterales]|uniref:type I-E CRISPR-associated protein Cse1/CasA n=1 Tax=Enterobacterales TaxID=91347 RepID=UPI002EDBA03A